MEDDCSGIFVDLNATTNGDGSRSTPYNTWSSAIADPRAALDTIFMCVGTEKLDSTAGVTITTPVNIWGGLDCKTWAEQGDERTSLVGSSDMVPLRLSSKASGTVLRRIEVTASNASKAGGSSIAIIAEGAEAHLINCNVTAGTAAKGAPGEPPSAGPDTDGDPGEDGSPIQPCDTDLDLINIGPSGTTKTCPDGTTSGGRGGFSMVSGVNVFYSSDGSPGSSTTTSSGAGGVGADYCTAGSNGDNGANGLTGGGATGLGMLSTEGYAGTVGASGGSGAQGGGGGGGGGIEGFMCSGTHAQVGPSGAAGGTGGCGGAGGNGGGPGGSSFAIAAIDAPLTLVQTSLTAGAGGKGGDGAPGAVGGVGGTGGKGGAGLDGVIPPACDGGDGGNGGTGGIGGGGHGGHSASLAFVGQAPVVVSGTFEVDNYPALGGDAPGGNDGQIGWACHTLGFDSKECH